MKFLKNLLGASNDDALIYDTGVEMGQITPRWPIIRCRGDQAHQIIAKEAQNRDHTPIVLGSMRAVEMMYDGTPRDLSEIETRAAKFSFDAYMTQARFEWAQTDRPKRGPFDPVLSQSDAITLALWDVARQEPYQTVHIGLFPTSDATQVPAYLDCGGWNAFPQAEVHMGLMRRWRDRYGARMVGHSHDTITMHALRPPATQEDAIALAEEHYAYCPDIIDQGFGTLDGLAAVLINAPTWQFWWD